MGDSDYIQHQKGGDYAGAEPLIKKEQEYLKDYRSGFDADNVKGLALSGGGIRSASFCLGVLQGLAHHKVLDKFDYLSTVSGGGYLGGALSWLWSGLWKDKAGSDTDFGVGAADFPFGSKDRPVDFSGKDMEKKQVALLRHLRQNGKYLTPGHGITALSFISIVLRSIVMGFVTLMILAGFVFSLLYKFELFKPEEATSDFFRDASVGVLLAYLALHLLYMLGVGLFKKSGNSRWGYLKRRLFESWLPRLINLFLLFLLFGLIHWVYVKLEFYLDAEATGGIAAALGALLGSIGGDSKWRKYISLIPHTLQMVMSAILMIFGLMVLADFWANYLFQTYPEKQLVFSSLLALLVLVQARILPINNISIHRYYRDRLMETFMPDAQKVFDDEDTRAAIRVNQTGVHKLDKSQQKAPVEDLIPYHLINTNIILVESKEAKYRGRGGDSFILSPLYSGSNATGWRRSSEFCNGGITLPTAVAISGAAANPDAGVAGKGLTTNVAISILMSIFNLRLGYWASNPDPQIQRNQSAVPSYLNPGFWEALQRSKMNEDAKFVQLSDGGHFENLALYELLRRRAKLIVICDAGADPQYEFSDLANAIEKARVDFGARIDISKKMLQALIPASDPAQSDMQYPVAEKSYLIADVHYSDEAQSQGKLLYIKTTLSKYICGDIHGYKRIHPDFPDQTTVDQFFDEVQFEAYRELGWQIVQDMMGDKKVVDLFN